MSIKRYGIMAWLVAVMAFPAAAAPLTNVQEVKGASGVTAWLVEDHSLPVISVRVSFEEAGIAHDPAGREGRALMTARLLSEGAGDKDSRAFQAALESRAIRFGAWAGADSFECSLYGLSEHADTAFSLLSDALFAPRFERETVERVRAEMISALKQEETQQGYKLSRATAEALFPAHPYGRTLSEQSLKALSVKDFAFIPAHYFSKNNIYISVVGDITPEKLAQLLDKTFARLPENATPDTVIQEVGALEKSREIHVPFSANQSFVRAVFPGLKREDPRYLAAFVLNHIVGGGDMSSRLGHSIREEGGLAYNVNSSLAPMRYAAFWQVDFATRNEKVDAALARLKAVLKTLREKGISPKELQGAKDQLTGTFMLQLDSTGDLADFLITMQRYRLGQDYLQLRNDLIRAVSLKDVNALSDMLDPEKMLLITVGEKENTHAK